MSANSAARSRAIGKLERLAKERHQRDLKLAYPRGIPADPRNTKHPRGLWFDAEAADHAVRFIESYCRHHKGEWAGQPLILEPWQKDDIIRPLFGWRRADGTRRYRFALIEIARKNGKSELGAAIGLYLTVADCEPGAEVYSSATKKDQAKIVHDTAREMVKKSPDLKRFVRVLRNNINCPELGSKFEPLGSDSNTLDGLNPHGNIIDEIHAHRDRKVFDVLVTAMGARRQPLTLIITTAGIYDPESIGWEQHDYAVKVLEGIFEDDGFFAFIAASDEGDNWEDPASWEKANPNIDVSVKREYLAELCEKAKKQPSFQNTFFRYHLDRWTQQRNIWIQIEKWNACDKDLAPTAYAEREKTWEGRVAYGGMDLSSKLDITAVVLVLPWDDGQGYDLVPRFWIPEEDLEARSRRDRVPYDAWVRDGWVAATPGNVIDYDFIRNEVVSLAGRFDLRELGFDPYSALQLSGQLGEKDGIQMVEVRQGWKSMSEPSKEFEKMVVSGQVRHGGHPVLRWMVSNASVRHDANANIAPDKGREGAKATGRIDGVVATIIALSRAIVQPADESAGWLLAAISTGG